MIKAVKAGKVSCVVVAYRDRLTRFGFEFLQTLFYDYGVGIQVVADELDKTLHERLLEDFMSLLACFSGKMYKTRSLHRTGRELLQYKYEKIIRKRIRTKKRGAWRKAVKRSLKKYKKDPRGRFKVNLLKKAKL